MVFWNSLDTLKAFLKGHLTGCQTLLKMEYLTAELTVKMKGYLMGEIMVCRTLTLMVCQMVNVMGHLMGSMMVYQT